MRLIKIAYIEEWRVLMFLIDFLITIFKVTNPFTLLMISIFYLKCLCVCA